MPADPRDFKLDLSTEPVPARNDATDRRFLRVQFACCGAYQRVYLDAEGKAYRGRCPKCGKPVMFPVGPGGTTCRDFRVY